MADGRRWGRRAVELSLVCVEDVVDRRSSLEVIAWGGVGDNEWVVEHETVGLIQIAIRLMLTMGTLAADWSPA